MSLSVSSFGRC